MSNAVLSKYRGLTPLNNQEIVDGLWRHMTQLSVPEAKHRWFKSEDYGFVFLFSHDDYPNVVLEYVQGSRDDSVTTIYAHTREVASLEALSNMRKELINEIGAVLLALPQSVVVRDEGREREVALKELGTAQLVDVLAHFTQTDIHTA
ncbi:hypothetical protein [Methyloversatilis sp.]|uniref:hypothetical protein n=1 Tax=Methyloversatilis sp. TaxID=2569862 RepID=UPI0035B178EF